MILLLDIGNTRIKIAHIADINARTIDAIGTVDTIDTGELVHIGNRYAPRPIAACFVAKSHQNLSDEAIRSALAPICSLVVFTHSQSQWRGLVNAYTDPSTLGVDRWLGMVYAWHSHASAAAILSLGTCITFDEIDDNGTHLGGCIATGRATNHANLSDLLHKSYPLSDAIALGKTTETAMDTGCNLAFIAMVEKLISSCHAGRILISGGDAPLALERVKTPPKKELLLVENIALNGLLIIANTSDSA